VKKKQMMCVALFVLSPIMVSCWVSLRVAWRHLKRKKNRVNF